MKVKTLAPAVMIGFTLITAAISSYSNYSSLEKMMDNAKMRELQNAANFIQYDLQQQTDKAAARASLVANMALVQDALRTGNRTELEHQLVPAFLQQNKKYDVTDASFFKAPATTFLRLFNLPLFDDDVSSYREMILTGSKKQKQTSQEGLEIGREGLSVRGVSAVIDAQGFIGSFEVATDFNQILDHIKQVTGFDSAVFIDDALMTKVALNAPKVDADKIIGAYRAVGTTNWETIHPMVNPTLFSKLKDISYQIKTVNGTDFGLVQVPLLDFKGAQIGSIVTVANFDNYNNEEKVSLVTSIVLGLIQAIILTGILIVILRGFFLSPIKALTDKLTRINNGDTDLEVGSLTKSTTEIGELARTIESTQKYVTELKTLNNVDHVDNAAK
jgi:methyl-accepting chemotaxis protein